jgi:hypothetical protein
VTLIESILSFVTFITASYIPAIIASELSAKHQSTFDFQPAFMMRGERDVIHWFEYPDSDKVMALVRSFSWRKSCGLCNWAASD